MSAMIRHSLIALLLIIVIPSSAYAAPPLRVDAASAMMVDATHARVLFAQDADRPLQPASLTKILSLSLAYDALQKGQIHRGDKVRISRNAWRTGGSRMFLEPASEVPLEEIIRGMSIVSANDASVALAEYLGGDVAGFVRMMNAKARELGMSESWFVNPHGLPARGQVSTARDLMKLARSYIERFPEAMTIHALRNYTYHDITQKNRNRLLGRFAGADGLKTGYVAEAGYHLIATARRGDTRLIAVVLGAKTPRIREKESLNLLEAGFRMLEKSRPTMTNSKKSVSPPLTGGD